MNAAVDLADLARLFAASPELDHARAAALLGLRLREPAPEETTKDDPAPQAEAPAGTLSVTAEETVSAAHDEPMSFWRMESETRDTDTREGSGERGDVTEDVPDERLDEDILHDTTRSIFDTPPTEPLTPWSRLWPRLQRALQGAIEGRDPDVGALVRMWGRGEIARKVPRVKRRVWAGRVALWVDRSERLLPFWDDQDEVHKHLRALCGREAVRLCRVDHAAEVLTAAREGVEADVPVLVLGDLGAYGTPYDRACWRSAAEHLQRCGVRRSALVVCPPERLDAASARAWSATPWEHDGCDHSATTRDERAAALLRLAAPAALVQPGMLRALRKLLPSTRVDASTEADVWQHADLSAQDASGMAFRTDAARRWRRRFAEDDDLDDVSREAARDVIAAWHAQAPRELMHAETLAWHSWARRGGVGGLGDLPAAREFARRVEGTLVAGAVFGEATEDVRRYGRELTGALHERVYKEVPELVRVWRESHRGVEGVEVPRTIPRERLTGGARFALRDVAVRQVGDVLVVSTMRGSAWPSEARGAGSPVATLAGVGEHLLVRYGDGAWWQRVFEDGMEIALRNGSAITLGGARGEVVLRPWARESWATAAGRDHYGLWAEFKVKGVAYRMRWIPAGTFMMGSPEAEVGRFDREVLHAVTLTRGYWLVETPVTQGLWEAVMGKNPSGFEGDDRPVESVSWEDCREFCARLNEQVPGLEVALPTEAQWERACRAGTTTATWLGDLSDEIRAPELEPIAWYRANSGNETHAVRGKAANPYGLYDVLGNVWEWCSDWYGEYSSAPAIDPIGAGTGAERVVRGGSFFNVARLVRAAIRLADAPGNRDGNLGLRLCRGQESALRSTQAGAGERRGAAGGRGAGRDTHR